MYKKLILFSLSAGFILVGFQNCAQDGFQSFSSEAAVESQSLIEPEDPAIDPGMIEKVYTNYEPLMADRVYLQSLIEDVFGPASRNLVQSRIYVNGQDFGSPCQMYEAQDTFNPATNTWAIVDVVKNCTRAALNFDARTNPKTTVTRSAIMTRVCSELTTNDTTLNFAMQRLRGSAGLPNVDQATFLKLFHLFYRNRPDPNQTLIDSLNVMFPPSGVTREHWRSAIYTVCASGYWQVL